MKNNSDKKRYNRIFPWVWSSRFVSFSAAYYLIAQVSFYATENAGLSIGLVSALILFSRVFDGLTDITAGFIIDKTRTRWGKARPYELFIIPTWILLIMLFSIPRLSGVGKASWFFILYLLINAVTMTFLTSSEPVYLGRATTERDLQARAVALASMLAVVSSVIISIFLPYLMDSWGRQEGGWTKIMLLFGIPCMTFGLIRFFFIRELPEEEIIAARGDQIKKAGDISVKDTLKLIACNKYIFLIGALSLMSQIINGLNTVMISYFFEYYIRDLTRMSLVAMLGAIASLSYILFPLFVRKWGAVNYVKMGLVLAVAGNVIKYFAGTSMTGILIGSVLSLIPGPSVMGFFGSIFVIQCMDYGQWKTGVRIEGPLSCVFGFSKKVGTGLGSALVGIILAATGFIEGAAGSGASQPAEALMAIRLCYSLFPAAICILMLIVLHFYDLERNYNLIKKQLTDGSC